MQRHVRPAVSRGERPEGDERDSAVKRATFPILRERFIRSLAHRIDQMDVCRIAMQDAGHHGLSVTVLETLTRHFQNLAAIAATFGCAAITRTARRGEWICMTSADRTAKRNLELIEAILDELRRAVAVTMV
jgi:hypothetical protein